MHYSPGKIGGRLSQLNLTDVRKFRLRAFKADFEIVTKDSNLKNNSFLTSRNAIHVSFLWKYPSWEKAITEPAKTQFKIVARANTLNLDELAYFMPVLLRYRTIYPLYAQHIRLNVQASGSPRDIRLNHLNIATDHSHAQGKGEIHTPKRGDTWMVFDIKNGFTGRRGLLDVVSAKDLSSALLDRMQEKIRLNGKMRITSRSLQGSVAIQSTIGALRLKGLLSHFSDLNRVNYNLTFNAKDFQVGEILKDTLFFAISK